MYLEKPIGHGFKSHHLHKDNLGENLMKSAAVAELVDAIYNVFQSHYHYDIIGV